MGGAGLAGSGGVGVGGWQLYEGVINPTTHRQLTSQGYTWNPAEVPLNDEVPVDNKKFEWKNWDSCTKKLFPNLTIKHEEKNETTTVTEVKEIEGEPTTTNGVKPKIKIYLNTPITVTEKFVACSLFDLRGDSDGSKNKIYFKSETAVRDENYGWIMWSGFSNTPSNNSGKITFEYRLLTLKKNNENWEIDKGFGWSSPQAESDSSSGNVLDQLYIIIPAGNWQTTRTKVGSGYSTRKVWSGIAKVDKSSSKHLVESLDIYLSSKGESGSQDREFWGITTGKYAEPHRGYYKTNKVYDSSAGWKTIQTPIDLGDSLTEWYKPFRGGENYSNPPNVKWMTCEQWSGNRGTYSPEDLWNKTMQEMCYTQIKN